MTRQESFVPEPTGSCGTYASKMLSVELETDLSERGAAAFIRIHQALGLNPAETDLV
jgi:hypothetical protein